MRVNRYNIWMAAIIITCNSCESLQDKVIDLGSGYVYRTDGHLRWIRSGNVMKEDIYPNVLSYDFDEDYIIVLQEPNIKDDKEYLAMDLRLKYSLVTEIYAKEKDNRDVNKFLQSHFWRDSVIHRNVIDALKTDDGASYLKMSLIADSISKNDPFFIAEFAKKRNYWIIDKKSQIVFGPFEKDRFIQEKKKLRVNDNLKFKDGE